MKRRGAIGFLAEGTGLFSTDAEILQTVSEAMGAVSRSVMEELATKK